MVDEKQGISEDSRAEEQEPGQGSAAVAPSIASHREAIDEIDAKIVELLNARASESLAIRALKPANRQGLYDPRREDEILARVAELNEGPLYDQNLHELFGAILKVMKETPYSSEKKPDKGDAASSEVDVPEISALSARGPVTIIAGPCAVESREQFDEVASCISELGLHWMRGGAYKPRTSPRSFQGLGEHGLEIMREAADERGLKVLTEVVDIDCLEACAALADGLQIGARNFQNYSLLSAVGKASAEADKPVLFKRGFCGTIGEWLQTVEYLTAFGNDKVMLCERGIRTFETATRFTLDISAVPIIQRQSRFPVCVDVSHPAGQRDIVPALARAAVAAGADAILVEVHPRPKEAKSDGPQQLTCDQLVALVAELRAVGSAIGREVM